GSVMRVASGRGDEAARGQRYHLACVERSAQSHHERTFEDGDVLIGRMGMWWNLVAVREAKTYGEQRGAARVALEHRHLRARREYRRCGTPLQIGVERTGRGRMITRARRGQRQQRDGSDDESHEVPL